MFELLISSCSCVCENARICMGTILSIGTGGSDGSFGKARGLVRF